MYQKLALDPFLVLLNNPKQPLHSRNSFKKWDILKKDHQKACKKLSLFSLSNSVPFNGQSYQKQKGSGTSAQLLSRLWNKFRKIPLFVVYILSDKVWWCNIKQFLSCSQNYFCRFMQVSSWLHKLFHFLLSFWIRKVWKGRGKNKKNWIISRTKRAF